MRFMLLEPMRGLAALWVFAFHYHFSESFVRAAPKLQVFFELGALGIPMFFVLSGFCITGSARASLRRGETWWSFLYRRLRRIYPPYWLSIVVVATLPLVPDLIGGLVKNGQIATPRETHLRFFARDAGEWFMLGSLLQVFATTPEPGPLWHKFSQFNAVCWSLAIEVQFYVVVAAMLLMRRWFYPLMAAATLLSLPVALSREAYYTGSFLPYWGMFALGIVLYWCFERGWRPSRWLGKWAAPICGGIALMALVAFVLHVVNGQPVRQWTFAWWFALFLFVVEGCDHFFVDQGISSSHAGIRFAVGLSMALGAMSYSLYLLHGTVSRVGQIALRKIAPSDNIAFDLTVIAATCATAYAFYWFCERPFMGSRQIQRDPIAGGEVVHAPETAISAADAG